jgi:hypothetical protein
MLPEKRVLYMKIYLYLRYVVQFFLELEIFQTKVVEKIKTPHFILISLFRKSCRLRDNVEKYGWTRQATDDNIIRLIRCACWKAKTKNTHLEFVTIIVFPQQLCFRERASMLLSLSC